MTKRGKPTRSQELEVRVDAPLEAVWAALTEARGLANWFPPQAAVSAPGVGGQVTVTWPEMAWTVTVETWDPGRHLGWIDESGFMGPGTVIAVDYHLSTEGGQTRLRLVQSGFGESAGWDDFFEGTRTGWTYFLHNLRVYLEKHLGRVRQMIAGRFEVKVPRELFWRRLVSAATGLVVGGGAALRAGDEVQLRLSERLTVRAAVELVVEGRALVLRMAQWRDALLFVELEGSATPFHVGCWLSVYDEAIAREIEPEAKQAFARLQDTLAAPD